MEKVESCFEICVLYVGGIELGVADDQVFGVGAFHFTNL